MTAPDEHLPALELVCQGAAELLRTLDHPLRRLTVRVGDILVEIEWPGPVPAAVAAPFAAQPTGPAGVPPAGPGAAASTVADTDAPAVPADPSAHLVTAPHVGTFYHCPEPGADPFVTEGDVIRRGQQIGILEAMKLMNPIEADRDGRVLEVLVADGTPVEFEQPLISLAATDPPNGSGHPGGQVANGQGVANGHGAPGLPGTGG